MKVHSAFLLTGLFAISAGISFAHNQNPGIPPERALQALHEGNLRFVKGNSKGSYKDATRRRELTKGQTPSAVVLSCSDSRVPPEIVFDKGLGELFTVRVAGNILDPATVASVEYAVSHLGVRLIVVMGHEACGAVKAALSTPIGQTAGSPDLDILISAVYLEKGARNIASDDPLLRKPVMNNVDAVAKGLLLRSKIIQKQVEEGRISIVRAIYQLESGIVEFWHTGGQSDSVRISAESN